MLKKVILAGSLVLATIFANAQVGIGTTTPSNALDVETNEAGGTAIDINNTGTGDPKINLQINGTTNFSIGVDNDDADKLKIGTTAPETNTRVTIDNAGNVGIGTSSPNAPLQIKNNFTNRTLVLWEGANDNHQFYGFGINPNILRYQVPGLFGNHIFYAATSSTTSNELMRIQGDGKVGVGTSTPVSTFDIQGSLGYKVTTVTAATTLDQTHNVILCNNGPYTVTLPPAAANTSRVYRIKNIDPEGDAITVDGNGTETIDGALTYALEPYKQSITIISDGANWHIIEYYSEGGGSQVGTITSIDCGSATNVGALISGTAANGVTSQISYTGGNAGPHNGQTVNSTGVTGLIATLTAGDFAAGNGSLTYTITGTPASTGTANFAINIGGQTCTLARTVGVASSGGTAVVSTWTSTVGCSVGAGNNNAPAGVRRGGVNETMVQGVAAPATASITLVANVTTVGTYNILTNTVNGVSFSASGTFGSTGDQTVTLTPSGTPTAAGNFKWATVLTPSIDVYGSVVTATAPNGSTYTNHFNGIVGGVHNTSTPADPTYFSRITFTSGETFNNNATCANKPISAQGCAGVTQVTASSGRVHPTLAINGQCWFQTNLITTPSVYNNYTTASWTNTSPGDQGYFGYNHDVTTNGTAGWKTTEPAANVGYLYQWCGAMDATISERSRGICPAGWHIPSDCEWMYLEHGLGMSIANQNIVGTRGQTQADGFLGGKLSSSIVGGANSTNFNGIFPGFRGTDGSFSGGNVMWWTSTALVSNASTRHLLTWNEGIVRNTPNYNSKSFGFSVRCLKD